MTIESISVKTRLSVTPNTLFTKTDHRPVVEVVLRDTEGVGPGPAWYEPVDFAREVAALGIPGLTYEPPQPPMEPGLYIEAADTGVHAEGVPVFRLSPVDGKWFDHGTKREVDPPRDPVRLIPDKKESANGATH